MLVLRIEDREGIGCYSRDDTPAAASAHDLGDCPCEATRHPPPYGDEGLKDAWRRISFAEHPRISSLHVRFAFASVAQYHRWFYTERAREILQEEGFFLAIYAVPEDRAVIGNTQAMFDRKHARRLTQLRCAASADEIEDCLTYCALREASRAEAETALAA